MKNICLWLLAFCLHYSDEKPQSVHTLDVFSSRSEANRQFRFRAGERVMWHANRRVDLPATPFITLQHQSLNTDLYVPLRPLIESLGGSVEQINARSVHFTLPN